MTKWSQNAAVVTNPLIKRWMQWLNISELSWFALILGILLVAPSGSALLAQSPPNNQFASRIPLSGTNVTATGWNTNASKEIGEPNHAGNIGGQSVWWTWTAPANGDLIIKTDGSDFDTLLGVYTGSSVSALSLVASNDDHGASVINGIFTNGLFSTSRVRFQVTSGTQYQIAVDGFSDGFSLASGTITLSLAFASEPIVRPVNDNFSNRLSLIGSPIFLSTSNTNATRQPGEPYHASRMGDTSVWWSWTAPANDTVRITTDGSTFDTLLAVYTGSSLSNLIVVASNDDEDPVNAILTSAVTFDTSAGQIYQIAVDGFDGASGQISLRIDPVATRLNAPTRLVSGAFQFTLTGLAGRTYEIDASADLQAWAPLGTFLNTNGSLLITDPAATNLNRRFYRAMLRP